MKVFEQLKEFYDSAYGYEPELPQEAWDVHKWTVDKACEVLADVLDAYDFERTDAVERIVKSFKKNME